MDLTGVLDIIGKTDPGKVRSQNEDSIGEAASLGAVVLADGMGGYQSGEVASALAVNTILNHLHETIPETKPGSINPETGYSEESIIARTAIKLANDAIFKAASAKKEYHGMGTTVVLGIFHDNRLTVAHVGDSRMYRIRGGVMEQLTVDHTLLQELVDRGFYSQEEAEATLSKNLVTRALGIESSVAVDISEVDVHPGDIYLLCSDGLNDMIDDEDILLTINTFSDNLQATADKLIMLANENGGRDNVSVVLARPTKAYPASKPFLNKVADFLF